MTMPARREHEFIHEYYSIIKRWKRRCNDRGISDEEFLELYNESLQYFYPKTESRQRNSMRLKYYLCVILAIGLFLLVLVAYAGLPNNMYYYFQDNIYPGLRLLRKLFIPLISMFPSLTAMYHQTCLIHNPFFTVADMDCWPCTSINYVREYDIHKPDTKQTDAPFIYKTKQDAVSTAMLKNFYASNKRVIDKEAPLILTDNKFYSHPTDMFSQLESGNKHLFIWEFNNMNIAKTLRLLIPRPEIVPKFGQSTERYIIIDTSQEQFQIPDTECSFSFLLSLSGSRTIELKPAEECKHQCKFLKVELKETYLLWYNWWYWRPIVQPSTGNGTFITHVGSYC